MVPLPATQQHADDNSRCLRRPSPASTTRPCAVGFDECHRRRYAYILYNILVSAGIVSVAHFKHSYLYLMSARFVTGWIYPKSALNEFLVLILFDPPSKIPHFLYIVVSFSVMLITNLISVFRYLITLSLCYHLSPKLWRGIIIGFQVRKITFT